MSFILYSHYEKIGYVKKYQNKFAGLPPPTPGFEIPGSAPDTYLFLPIDF